MGQKERYYYGAGILFATMGFVLAYFAPGSLGGFAAVLTPICLGLYGGGLGKLYIEATKNGAAK